MIDSWAKTFINNIASITPSGYAGLNTLIKIQKTPTKNPYIHFPVLVLRKTGSVAIKTSKSKASNNKMIYPGNCIKVYSPKIE